MKTIEVTGDELKAFKGLIHSKADDRRLEHIAIMIDWDSEITIVCRDFFDSEINNICISFPIYGSA